jgi:tetratricopeptide (TPR) repeat protein
MKNLQIITFFLLVLLFSCRNEHEACEEADKVSAELRKFDDYLITLYKEAEKNPEKVIRKSDSLFITNKKETERYRSQIKSNVESKLHYLKAEIFYKTGKYKESIEELNFEDYRTGEAAIAYAANYVKLKDFKSAKSFIDSIGNWNGNYYALGNYYESIGDKTSALKTYKENLEDDKSRKHFIYYIWTQKRVEELEKNNPLLNEVFFPTGNPSFEICEICNVDNEKREKITKLLIKLPENKNWSSTAILESPYDTGKDYYWIRVTAGNREINYYVYPKNYEIKYFNPKTKTLKTLEEWRTEN